MRFNIINNSIANVSNRYSARVVQMLRDLTLPMCPWHLSLCVAPVSSGHLGTQGLLGNPGGANERVTAINLLGNLLLGKRDRVTLAGRLLQFRRIG